MRNIVGQTPRGEDFFPRDKIINLIYRRLNSGVNIYMAAPRRVGKTAIMRYLEDNPRDDYEFWYIITESIDNPVNYFKRLSEALYHLKSLSKKSLDKIKDFIPRIDKISLVLTGVDVKFAEEAHKVFEEFKNLIKGLETQGKTIVIMVDEFPQTVENILRQHGQAAAEQFLQFNREIRHQASANIRFLLTGSIGLPSIAEKLAATKEINDLNVIEIPPLSRAEAQQLVTELFAFEQVFYDNNTIAYLLDRISYFVPFHLQLLVQELTDIYFDSEEKLNKAAVDKAFAEVLDKRNDIYFVHYYSRLADTFEDKDEYNFALAVLQNLTVGDELTSAQLAVLAQNYNLGNFSLVLRTLDFDGYIFRSEQSHKTVYRFTSLMLKLWWQQYVTVKTESVLITTDLGAARIIEFSIYGLAGYDKVYARQLNADVNVFFGLNGSGKTSLLKILHSAMSDDIDILEGVAFKTAEVKIYSIALDKVFIRTIDVADAFVWKTEPKIAQFVGSHHIFLSIFRIGSEATEVKLARHLQELWKQYAHEISETIRKAQEKGLADILKAMLSMKSQNKEEVNTKVDPETAYKLVANFLERQGNIAADVLGTQAEFKQRYLKESHIQNVVNDINEIENDIEKARQPQRQLQQLIQDLFSGNKELQFKEQIEMTHLDGSNLDLSVLSSGEKQLILILLETFLAKESCILIDEPEISMHIDWQERLVDAMRQLNPSVQIILTTHTPEMMVNIEDDRIFRL